MNRLRSAWGWVKIHRLSIWVVSFTAAVVFALAAGHQQRNDLHETNVREAKEDVVEEAQACVTGWTVRESIRDAIERATVAGGEAILAVATDVEPETANRFREQLTLQGQAAGNEIPNPECDLDEARTTVAGGIDKVELP